MNEKVANFLLLLVIAVVGFLLLQMCTGKGGQSTEQVISKEVTLPAAPAGSQPAGAPATETAPATGPAAATAPAAGEVLRGPRAIILGSATDPRYKLEVTLTSRMAGVERVKLNIKDFAQRPDRKEPLTLFESPRNVVKPFGVLKVSISGVKPGDPLNYSMLSVDWPEAKDIVRDGDVITSATFRNQFLWGTLLIAEVERKYTIAPNSYDVDVVTRVINKLPDREITVAIDQLGSIELPQDSHQYDSRYVQTAKFIPQGKGRIEGEAAYQMHDAIVAEAFKKPDASSPPPSKVNLGPATGTGEHVVWTAQANRFFTTIVRPLQEFDPAGKVARNPPLTLENSLQVFPVGWVASADAMPLAAAPLPTDVPLGVHLTGAGVKITAAESMCLPLRAYMGPKDALIFGGDRDKPVDSEEYAKAAFQYSKLIKYSQGGPCGACTFDWLVKPILWLLGMFYKIVGNYGVAILVLTLFVRLLLHPLTRMGQVQMAVMQKKMATVQPEIEKVKKKYEKDKKTQQMEIMRVYRENNVNPAGGLLGCLPMLLQTPIWLALFGGLATAIALRHAPFIHGWINDLSNPDTVYRIPLAFHVWILGYKEAGQEYLPINVLPILLGVLFFVQMKVMASATPKPADPQQAQTQKISQYMILLFPLFLYHGPSGLNLYMVASTIGGMFDTWLIRKSLRAKGILPAPTVSPM